MKSKIKTRKEIAKIVSKLKKEGKTIVTANGSFDLFHVGHVKFLQRAKKQGDILIIGLNSDDSVKKWKKHIGYPDWNNRPVQKQNSRSEMLAALECVDYVEIFKEINPLSFIENIKPNVHVNGSDYGKDCIEALLVKKHGGKIYIVNKVGGDSTSDLIKKIKSMKD